MATGLHCAPIISTTLRGTFDDPLTKIFAFQDSWLCYIKRPLKLGIEISFDQLQESMDRLLDKYNRESIRNTMMKHEEIFKQQVHDLHQLYQVQKMLMAKLRSRDAKLKSPTNTTTPPEVTDARTRFWSSTSTSETSHSSHVSNKHYSMAQLNSESSSAPRCSTMALPSSLEAENPLRTQIGFDLELRSEEDQDKANSSRKQLKEAMSMDGPNLWADGESDVELTLSIGCGSNQKKPKQWLDPNIGLGCSKPTQSENRQRGEECSDPAAGFDRESLQRPSWILQALSLSRT